MLEFPPVLTKKDFAARYCKGEFGNMPPTWTTLEGFLARDESLGLDLFHLRNGVTPGGTTYYKQTAAEIEERWPTIANPGDWFVSAQIPERVERRLLVQGEVCRVTNGPEVGLALYYSRVPSPMREALATEAKQVYGVTSSMILRASMCPNSYEWLQVLLDRYPFHVVEFSSYDCNWGQLPNFNSIVWEVRAY